MESPGTASVSTGRRAGFTLLEMIIVVAILVLMAGIAVPLAATELRRERRLATIEEMKHLSTALEDVFHDTLAVPRSLRILRERPKDVDGWCGPYVSPGSDGPNGHLEDSWGRPYLLGRQGSSLLVLRSTGDDTERPDDDLVREIDLTPVRRQVTLERLAVVNAAINRYQRDDIKEPPAPSVTALLDRLVRRGYLPSDPRLRVDAWGDGVVADPLGGRPIVRVTSIHFLVVEGGAGVGPRGPRGGDGGGGMNNPPGGGREDDNGDDAGIRLPPGFNRGPGRWKGNG